VSQKKIVALGGDGVGPEIMEVTCEIMEKAGFGLEIIRPLHGEAALKAGKEVFSEELKNLCRTSDAILFGASGGISREMGGQKPYFEPVHGSAPDIAGKGIVNPTAMILSAKMMLDHLGMINEAQALEKAVAEVYRQGEHLTTDQGGRAPTKEFAEAVLQKI